MKKKVVFIIIFISLIGIFTSLYIVDQKNKTKERDIKEEKRSKKETIEDIQSHYSTSIKTNKKTTLYQLENGQYKKVGTVNENTPLVLKKIDTINEKSTYFSVEGIPYYIFYKDVEKLETAPIQNQDYKHYIPFPESIVTKNIKLYQGETLVYDIKGSLTSPILIKDGNHTYIEYNQSLYYVKEEDIDKIIPNVSGGEVSTSMTVLNYHFFYNDGDSKCGEILCIKRSSFDQQLKYLSDHGYYTVSMKEFEWYMDKKVLLPKKSVLITADDGAYGTTDVYPEVLKKYNMKATLFLITGFNDKNKYTASNVELHSHSNLMHTQGVCPGGQGGGIKCLSEEKILADLQITRDLLGNTNAFAYPFYEYNTRATEILRKAGFTLAFIGGNKKAVPGMNKMLIPRYPVVSSTSMSDFIKKLS